MSNNKEHSIDILEVRSMLYTKWIVYLIDEYTQDPIKELGSFPEKDLAKLFANVLPYETVRVIHYRQRG